MKHVFGPVPSRRLGRSLGVSPIPQKTCNYSCVYCQLGRTDRMTNQRHDYFSLQSILAEADEMLEKVPEFDVISIVGEGEPTLYLHLGELIAALKQRTDKPVALITNGALFYDPAVRQEAALADIVLPSLDSYDEKGFRKVDRPHGHLHFQEVFEGLVTFTQEYTGELCLELMLLAGINDAPEDLRRFRELLKQLRYDKLYINTPVRPPAEKLVQAVSREKMAEAAEFLQGISIGALADGSFFSDVADDYEAVLSIIRRHPMNQHEIGGFLASRKVEAPTELLEKLKQDPRVVCTLYKGYETYRIR